MDAAKHSCLKTFSELLFIFNNLNISEMKVPQRNQSPCLWAWLPLLLALFFMGKSSQAQDLFKEMKGGPNLANIKGKDVSFQEGYLYFTNMDGKARMIFPFLVNPMVIIPSEDDFTFSHIAGKSAIKGSVIHNLSPDKHWFADNGTNPSVLATRDKKTNKLWRVTVLSDVHKIFAEASPWVEKYTLPKKAIDFAVYDGLVSWVDKDNKVWTRSNGNWLNITGNRKAQKITVDSKGRLWIVGTDRYIYYRNNNTWVRYGNNSNVAKDIVVPDKTPVVVGTDDILHMGTKAID